MSGGRGRASLDREAAVARLARERPRQPFVLWSGIGFALLVAYAWLSGGFAFGELVTGRRLINLQRFARELLPYPLQGQAWNGSVALGWLHRLMDGIGWQASADTLAISIAAIMLAGCGALVTCWPAARTFAAPEPYLPRGGRPSLAVRAAWASVVWATRALLILLRAIPEYVWAFLLVAVIGPTPWAAVLALALHNAGILGKLCAEAIENLEDASLSGLRALGARRPQIVLAGILPAIEPRFLLFFFYRWETCLREATVLGMLGIVSLGYYVQDARARQHYDVMLALILLGSVMVIVGDLLSAGAREAVRRSG